MKKGAESSLFAIIASYRNTSYEYAYLYPPITTFENHSFHKRKWLKDKHQLSENGKWNDYPHDLEYLGIIK